MDLFSYKCALILHDLLGRKKGIENAVYTDAEQQQGPNHYANILEGQKQWIFDNGNMKLLFIYILFGKGERTQSIAQNSNPLKHYTQSKGINQCYKQWMYSNCMEHRTLQKLTAMWLLKFLSFCGFVGS